MTEHIGVFFIGLKFSVDFRHLVTLSLPTCNEPSESFIRMVHCEFFLWLDTIMQFNEVVDPYNEE